MLTGIKGDQIKQKSVEIAKQIREYEDTLFKNWTNTVSDLAAGYLKEFILKRDASGKSSYVNFNNDLLLIIQETKYLDKLGRK
ncbi:hypothetical protein J0687_24750, partial [Vibrio alginolyticus]|nr:hypothetical protein [Vibrio alginolyticus]